MVFLFLRNLLSPISIKVYFVYFCCSYYVYNWAAYDYISNNNNRTYHSDDNDDWYIYHLGTNDNFHWTNDHAGNYNTKYIITNYILTIRLSGILILSKWDLV